MTFYDFITGVGCFLLAGLIPGVPVIIVLVIHTWWFDRKQQQLGPPAAPAAPAAPAPAHPYRAHVASVSSECIAGTLGRVRSVEHVRTMTVTRKVTVMIRYQPPCEWPVWAT